jgi:3-oxoacyl-[acyl-carrier protein] reductase
LTSAFCYTSSQTTNWSYGDSMDLGIEGKIAIVTGAAGGIGAATAVAFAEEKALVVLADIDGLRAEKTAAQIKLSGGSAIGLQADVTDQTSVENLVRQTERAFGTPDIIINNAGFTIDRRIADMTEADWDSVVDVVLKGAFHCTKAVLPSMVKKNWGRIVNISSRAYLGNPGQANYSAAKAGIIGFTKAMALENGRYNITANAVAPGIIETEAVRSLPHFEKIKENAAKTLAIRRMGVVGDVAAAVLFLASDLAGYITGDVLHVTGGRY